MMTLKTRRRGLAAALGFAAFAAALPSVADDSPFIIEDNSVNVSYSAVSEGTALVTATRRGGSGAEALEARYRTRSASEGIDMRTDERRGLYIIFR